MKWIMWYAQGNHYTIQNKIVFIINCPNTTPSWYDCDLLKLAEKQKHIPVHYKYSNCWVLLVFFVFISIFKLAFGKGWEYLALKPQRFIGNSWKRADWNDFHHLSGPRIALPPNCLPPPLPPLSPQTTSLQSLPNFQHTYDEWNLEAKKVALGRWRTFCQHQIISISFLLFADWLSEVGISRIIPETAAALHFVEPTYIYLNKATVQVKPTFVLHGKEPSPLGFPFASCHFVKIQGLFQQRPWSTKMTALLMRTSGYHSYIRICCKCCRPVSDFFSLNKLFYIHHRTLFRYIFIFH